MRKIVIYILYLFVVLFLHACQTESFPESKHSQDEGKVLLSGKLSYTGQNTRTRAVYESDIQRLDIMLFDEDSTFVEWHQANIVSSGMGACEYKAVLTATNRKRVLHFLLNFPFENYSFTASDFAGMHMSEVFSYIVDQRQYNEGGDHYMSMWGICSLPSIQTDTEIPSVSVIRTSASLSFEIPPELRNQLKLDRVFLFNVMSTGLLAPASFSPNPADWIRASEPGIRLLDTLNVESLNHYSTQLYTYERRVESGGAEDDFFIIIKAWYGEDSLDKYSYYKILPAEYDESESDPESRFKPLDIMRNTHYLLSFKQIESRGYATLSQALASPPSNNIVVETLSSTTDIHDEITNGQYKLGLSGNTVNLYEEPSSNTFTKIADIYLTEVGQGTGIQMPAMDEVFCVVELNENNLLLNNNNIPYNPGDTLQPSSEGELWVLINAYQQSLNRRGRIRVQAGNLCRQIELNQSRYSLFNLPEQLIIGWQAGSSVSLIVVPDTIKHYPLEISASLGKAALIWNNENYQEPRAAFLTIDQSTATIEDVASVQECSFTFSTTSVFSNADTAAYRVQEVILSAEGFLNDTVLIKQAKFP